MPTEEERGKQGLSHIVPQAINVVSWFNRAYFYLVCDEKQHGCQVVII